MTVVDQPPTFILGETDKSPDFLSKFPSGKVPALEIAGSDTHLNEANAIAEYLSLPDLVGKKLMPLNEVSPKKDV